MRKRSLLLMTLPILLLVGTSAAASYSLSVSTDTKIYTGPALIHLTGQVSPAPGPNTAVLIRIFNPNRVLVIADEPAVNGTTGSFSDTIVAGGSANWIDGNYVLNATWGAFGQTIFTVANFNWLSSATTTTSSTSSTTTTSTSSSSSSSSSTASSSSQATTTSTTSTLSPSTSVASSTTTSSGGGGIPEFPFQYVTVGLFTFLVIASYLYIARGRKQVPLLR